jgi:peptide/nickel transport system substrate-binding protein
LLAGAAAISLALAACGSSGGSSSSSSGGSSNGASGTKGTGNFTDCGTKANDCNSGKTKTGGTVTYTIEKTISGWNVNSAASNTFDYAEALDGVLPFVFNVTPDLKPVLNDNMMVSAEQTKADPQTLVYKIKPNAVWDDGSQIDATDFQYAWDSLSAAKCPKCAQANTSGYDQIKSMTPSDNGKTVTVVMSKPFADWKSMFGTMYPAHVAKQHGWDGTPTGTLAAFTWFDKNQPTYSGGPYKITGYTKDTSITETPNPKWYGATKPSLDKLIFRIITDQTQEVPALKNNEVQAIYPQPSADLVNQADAIQGVQTYLGKGLIWEHLDLNTKNEFLSDQKLRLAVFTAISRQSIIDRGVGQFVPGIKPLGNRLLLPGQAGYQDNVTDGQGSGDVAKAKQILTDAGYTGVGSALKTKAGKPVSFRCSYSQGNTLRQQTCQIVQATMKQLGIDIKLVAVPDLSILDKHDFDMVIFAWVGTPFITTGNYQIFNSTQASNYTGNKDPKVDQPLTQALTETDQSKIPTLMNDADKALEADAVSLPLFQKPTFLAAQSNIVNMRDNATSVGPPYNVEQWGLKG